jgi:integrase
MTRSRDRDGIQKLGEQHYRLSWTEAGTGKRRSRVVRGPLEDAVKVRATIVHNQASGDYVTPSAMTLRQYLDGWLDRRETMGETRPTTHQRYHQLFNSVCSRLGAVPLQALTKQEIESYYVWCLRHEVTRRGTLVNRDTVNKRHKALKKALDDAAEDQLILRNPAAKAKHPTPGKPHGQSFTRDEAQAVLAAVHESWVDLPVRVALHTGLRLGEVMALRWRDVHVPLEGPGRLTVAGTVTETKNVFSIQHYAKTSHSRATIAIGADLTETLKAHKRVQAEHRLRLGPAWEDNDLVVCGLYGQLLRPSKVTARFTPIIRVMEDDGTLTTKGATFHTLRHTHATLLLKDGVPVHVVSKRLRHSKIQITLDYYAHVMPGDDEIVADGFDSIIGQPHKSPTLRTSYAREADSGVESASL